MSKVFETKLQTADLSDWKLSGRVLDIGGGGEGIISRVVGDAIVAIDKRRDELEETADIGLKIVMDACDLQFLDNSFDHVTCFYALMYMDMTEVEKALREARRVLKEGGSLWIWDTEIPNLFDCDIFIAQIEVILEGGTNVRTGYGISRTAPRTAEDYIAACEANGFTIEKFAKYDGYFALTVGAK